MINWHSIWLQFMVWKFMSNITNYIAIYPFYSFFSPIYLQFILIVLIIHMQIDQIFSNVNQTKLRLMNRLLNNCLCINSIWLVSVWCECTNMYACFCWTSHIFHLIWLNMCVFFFFSCYLAWIGVRLRRKCLNSIGISAVTFFHAIQLQFAAWMHDK